MSQPQQRAVQSVDRACELLEVLAAADTALPLTVLAERTDLSAATAHRLLRTLLTRGYVRQTAAREYALGARLIHLGRRATPQLATLAQGVLAELESISEETANLAVLDGDEAAYIAQMPSRHRMRMFTEVGRRVLPHASGVGKAILSTLPEAQTLAIVERTGLPRYTPSTLVSPEMLLDDLRASRRRGFAIDDGEQEIGVRCIAVAVPRSSPPAAVSISGPAARVTDARAPEFIDALQRAARALETAAESAATPMI